MLLSHLRSQLKCNASRRNSRAAQRPAAAELLETRQLLSAVTLQVGASQDTTIYASDVDASNGSGEFLLAGSGTRSLVKFDVGGASIPEGSTIIDAVLVLNVAASTGGSASVSVHRVTSSWGEAGSNAPGDETTGAPAQKFDATWLYSSFDGELWNNEGGDFGGASGSTTVGEAGAYEWIGGGLIDDVQAWIDDASTNFGWLIQAAASGVKSFVSNNAPDAGLAPTLEITYEEPPLPPAIVEGRIWNDLNGDGIQTDALLSDLQLSIVNGNTYFDGFGGGEHWFKSTGSGRWYFLTEDGTLTKWSGVGGALTGTVVGKVDPKFYLEPGLVETSIGDPEPWLDGWTVELIGPDGTVVQTTVSGGRDSNGDDAIDSVTEGGWYRFEVEQGVSCTVRQVVPDGWHENAKITFDTSDSSTQAINSLDLKQQSSYYEDLGGLGEKWLFGDQSGWHYILPSGDLYRWDAKPITSQNPLNGEYVASPGKAYFDDPGLLANGGYNSDPNITNSDFRTDFGNVRETIAKGRAWLDVRPDGFRNEDLELEPMPPLVELGDGEAWLFDFERDAWFIIDTDGQPTYWGNSADAAGTQGSIDSAPSPGPQLTVEPWLNGRTIELRDEDGAVVATTTTESIDWNEDGEIDFETERGWYVFENIPLGAYTVHQVVDSGWRQTAPHSIDQSLATQLDAEFGFSTTTSDFRNWGGRNERWVIDRDNRWYFMLEDGSLHRWEVGTTAAGGGLKGEFIAKLSARHYLDLELLTNPDTSGVAIEVDGERDALQILFGNYNLLDDEL
ncbi:DNRLRE domain-containing protein [Fuerstiella marisgermanici]|uniref:SD-repeat containing protein B domain-containing protein n=1 Tax=Fuerstiella marisgermanici TaxID=1891926 RepID=A0A1P8W9Q2_9PLAN|nr:DNRLRE domain-containing protein [Fuerstiella marisgermanici]APZ90784.1 hypothetical protein Fuma_00368 [Fuerstiella marisgermanici]